ncbi:MAG TPA: type II toxin-antitoxin system RelE/ParE family toxin [Flavipsychrobacter sp.]|nr:type II toxin-antitoxin system RelE/ParE family toxin [Flavipsychrobacter sp.]
MTSKGKGKSGGARAITFVLIKNETVYLAAIYDKSDQVNISDTELKWLSQIIAQMDK